MPATFPFPYVRAKKYSATIPWVLIQEVTCEKRRQDRVKWSYLSWLHPELWRPEIIPDIRLLDYEEVLQENNYLAVNYPQLADQLWMIGTSGQGDGRFVERNTKNVLFYDHDLGEYESVLSFRNFSIGFSEFIQAAFMLRELETKLYEEELESGTVEHVFKASMAGISSTFMELYQYRYF